MITAYGVADTKRKALESGAEALFTKPIDFLLLRNEIDTRDQTGRVTARPLLANVAGVAASK